MPFAVRWAAAKADIDGVFLQAIGAISLRSPTYVSLGASPETTQSIFVCDIVLVVWCTAKPRQFRHACLID
jgi:hypothetical protein